MRPDGCLNIGVNFENFIWIAIVSNTTTWIRRHIKLWQFSNCQVKVI